MIEPAVAKSGSAGVSTFVLAAFAGPIDAATLLAAFAGSVVFVLSATEYHWLQRIIYLITSTVIGYMTAGWLAVTLGIASTVVTAILGGLLSITTLNGVIRYAKSGTFLTDLLSRLVGGKK